MPDNPMTEDGFAKLNERIDELRGNVIPDLERKLGEAREKGDLSENAEFDAAREKLWEAETKLGELQEMLANAFPVALPTEPSDVVSFGYVVDVVNMTRDSKETYHIVGLGESDLDRGSISFLSPIAQAFMNRKVGDTIKVDVPAGTFEYRIEAIRLPSDK